ncbi:MAG: hypothetical protein IJE59_02175 [Clostridia bacterium]|nr:hypothetical protein [Clostridia bacterium]
MDKFKYFLEKNKMLIIIVGVILICSIAIALGVYAHITTNTSTKNKEEAESANYEELKSDFEYMFTNNINKQATAKIDINYDELVYCKYDIKEEKNGKYSINAKIPYFKDENEETKKVNNEIYNVFAKKIIDIVNTEAVNNTYNIDYVAYVNNNIVSLVIRCKYKNERNPQREIIQTYNYDVENKKILNIQDILEYKELDKTEVQNKISEQIKTVNNEKEIIRQQGYNVYMRDESSEIYKVDNTPNFFIGKNNYLYLVYAYGNRNYTSEIDLIIF